MTHLSENKRIHNLIETVMKVARGHFSFQADISPENDELDALAVGLNMLIDDLAENVDLQTQYERLREINEELESAKEKAQESDRLKSAFLANMSHEIRTPMNAIIGFSTLLGEPGMNPESMKEYIGIIQNSGYHLLALINDILDLAKIESNQLSIHKEYCDIEDILGQVNDMISRDTILLNKPEVEFIYKPVSTPHNYSLFTDKIRIKQILTNLLTNAIKYTDSGTVQLSYSFNNEQSVPRIIISIKDSGIGIPEEFHEDIWERFKRVDNEQFQEGTGIGLSITKGLVDLLGGSIELESEPDRGTEFSVIFPCSVEKPNSYQDPVFSTIDLDIDLSDFRIYIAEDKLESFRLLKDIILSRGGQVKHAVNGKILLDLITEKVPDLVLLDIYMPEMNGYDTIREIRARGYSFPVIAQTAYAANSEKKAILDSGCDGYLSKPINPAALIREIVIQLKLQGEI